MNQGKKKSYKMKNICFTIFEETLVNRSQQQWFDFADAEKRIKYLAFQKETCPETKRIHIQGYCELARSIPLKTIKNMFKDKGMHIEARKGTQTEAIAYVCKHESAIPDSFYQVGEPMINKQGSREDIHAIVALVKTGDTNIQLLDKMPDVYFKYHKHVKHIRQVFTDDIAEQELRLQFTTANLRDWQKELVEELKQPPDDRTIRWIVDITGNEGKTWFAKWAHVNMDAQCIANGKTTDIAHAYEGRPIVILNLARHQMDFINYDVMEKIKDGLMWSPKYESTTKYFKAPHLIVMANQWPALHKVSLDRWKISILKEGVMTLVEQEDWQEQRYD